MATEQQQPVQLGAGYSIEISACADGVNKRVERYYTINNKRVCTGRYLMADLTRVPKRFEPWMAALAAWWATLLPVYCTCGARLESYGTWVGELGAHAPVENNPRYTMLRGCPVCDAPEPYPHTAFGVEATPEVMTENERDEIHRQLMNTSMLGVDAATAPDATTVAVLGNPAQHGTVLAAVDEYTAELDAALKQVFNVPPHQLPHGTLDVVRTETGEAAARRQPPQTKEDTTK